MGLEELGRDLRPLSFKGPASPIPSINVGMINAMFRPLSVPKPKPDMRPRNHEIATGVLVLTFIHDH